MMSPFWSLLLCLVLICGLQLAICHKHDAYISLHITHIIIITICVYCNFNILLGIYIQDICKYCHEADNQF